jgi:hypothetical protein
MRQVAAFDLPRLDFAIHAVGTAMLPSHALKNFEDLNIKPSACILRRRVV